MLVPRKFEERDTAVLHALIRAHPLGTWVTPADHGLVVNHIPFLLDANRGPDGTLIGHVNRANRVWESLTSESRSVVVFQGAETYITPSWYPSKAEHGRAVPTWNYTVVHAHGVPHAVLDRDWLLAHVTELSTTHEAHRAMPWRISDAPADYIDGMLKAIVGIEIPVTELVGQWKHSQNRPHADKLGIIAGLEERGDPAAMAMADLVRRHATNGEE